MQLFTDIPEPYLPVTVANERRSANNSTRGEEKAKPVRKDGKYNTFQEREDARAESNLTNGYLRMESEVVHLDVFCY